MNSPKQNLQLASLWFTMYDIKHKVFDNKLYLIVTDQVGKDYEIQVSNAEVNERSRLATELNIKDLIKNRI